MNDYANLAKIKNILLVRLDEIGDLVLTTPLLRELRYNAPQANISLVVKPQNLELVENCPYINRILTYDWQASCDRGIFAQWLGALKFSFLKLWGERLDLAILPRWDADFYQASFLAYSSLAKKRVAYSERVTERKARLNKGYNKLFTDLLCDISLKHEVERNLDVLTFLGGRIQNDRLELWPDQEGEQSAVKIIRNLPAQSGPLICFCVDAISLRKKWPLENYYELGRRLHGSINARIIIIGQDCPDLKDQIDRMFSDYPVVNLLGATTLSTAIALIRQCRLYVGNDTGLKHIAAAMNVPVVEISCWPKCGSPFSEYGPYRFTPWKTEYIVLNPQRPIGPCIDECVSLQAHCITQVTPDEAEEAVKKMLSKDDLRRV